MMSMYLDHQKYLSLTLQGNGVLMEFSSDYDTEQIILDRSQIGNIIDYLTVAKNKISKREWNL